ncbi:hypothetical protein [Phaeodactylibacter sp.]|uniref:hypothetical protein n=1 Tax=Phaeodactylibacter sp. TaxID=1940289 RepID=UPI0025CFA6EB|nr:hypothetical protein [Phaeodactylibacter sp.]MCI4647625.1 hypothetical protein [Phaeodactylibacter sp.]MCI5090579.1 hypothetical protein [Phaeodactylibacter sp.]
MFKRGDFVRVKPRTILDTGETAESWGGEMFHVDKEDGLYGMGVDLSSEEAIEALPYEKADGGLCATAPGAPLPDTARRPFQERL